MSAVLNTRWRGSDLYARICRVNQLSTSQNPWWHPERDDPYLDETLPPIVILAPDYNAGFDGGIPLWSEDSGQIAWRSTKFSPELLERLSIWQDEFDSNFHWEKGWRSDQALARWAQEATGLVAEVRKALGDKSELVVNLWPLKGTRLDPAHTLADSDHRPDAETPE